MYKPGGADSALPFSSFSTKRLLWENETPSSAFPSGTVINIDSSSYKALYFVFSYSTANLSSVGVGIYDKLNDNQNSFVGAGVSLTNGIAAVARGIKVTNTSITINTNGRVGTAVASDITANYAIPLKIYGIK